MRRSFEELAGDDVETPGGPAHCAGAAVASAAERLSASLYDCFDDPGNRVVFEGRTMTRVSALQLLQELTGQEQREDLFRALEPLWRAVNADDGAESPYRRLIRHNADAFAQGHSPVHDAAAGFGITVPQAERWLVQVLEAWAAANRESVPLQPWDYWFRYSKASRVLSRRIPRSALLRLQQRFFSDLGADPAALGVLFDIAPRPGKAPLAYSDLVRIGRLQNGSWRPALAWVSANDDRGGLGVLNELVHETGHAVHFMAIRARPALYWPDTTFIEAFADVPSWSVFTPAWQRRYLGESSSQADGLREQYAGVMLDIAWSLFEIRMLERPAQDPNALWSSITQEYLNVVPHPEASWWAMRSQLVTDPGYMVNYGLGAIITAGIRARTAAAIGSFDAGNPRWYAWLSAQLLASGDEQPLRERLRAFLGHEASPDELLRDIARISGGSNPH
ncbi:MAG: hypothetical protein JSR95_10965 [Proteobacteria bacterium]|nr:hypothetical protein [Pseudomonadota bacterium]